MIQITANTRILLAIEPCDFRRGIDGLARVCRGELAEDPFSGTVFCFRNRRASAVKLLYYDGQGFWVAHKRLSSGKFGWWPSAPRVAEEKTWKIAAHEVAVLLRAGDPRFTRAAPDWRSID